MKKRVRVIPVLLYDGRGLIKTIKFKNKKYIGDPINTAKLYNDKEVDELILLDIYATKEKRKPDFELIKNISGECFMPICYGGGVSSIEQVEKIINSGVEKISFNYSAVVNPDLIENAAKIFGCQSIVISVDIKTTRFGKRRIFSLNGKKQVKENPLDFVKRMESLGAGEVLLTSIDKEGTYSGYDLEIIKEISSNISIPLIAHGGAGSINDFLMAIKMGASAVAAGSLFIYNRKHRAVLVNYPSQQELDEKLCYLI